MVGRASPVRLSAAARGVAVVALAAPVLWSRDAPALLGLAGIGLLWTFSQVRDIWRRDARFTTVVIDAALVGAICGLALDSSVAVLGALAVPPFTAGIHRGLRAALLCLAAEVVATVTVAVVVADRITVDQGFGVFTWAVTGLGLGLIASFLHSTLSVTSDPLQAHRDAQALIRQLIDLSGGLTSGLDPVPLGGAIVSTVRDQLPTRALVLSVRRGDTLTPLVTTSLGNPSDLARCDDLAAEAWATGASLVRGEAFAVPLVTQGSAVAVLAGVLSENLDVEALGMPARVRALPDTLEEQVVRLDTALLFSALRDAATAEERRRLAREMHDGVAQDIASLGYVVDTLITQATDRGQQDQLRLLRDEISAVVAEVRRSVVSLRSSVGAGTSLGTVIGGVARHLSEVAGIPIHLTLDERPTRLRPEVESELFRIAQEAMTNAVRHSRARTIRVHCRVQAPEAQITVRDDGIGLQGGREDSHGLQIMRERARLIGADLTIADLPEGGLMVSVLLPAADTSGAVDAETPKTKAAT